MNRWLIALALSAGIAVPVAVIAQQQGQAPPMRQAPSPEMRSQMQKIFADAKTGALAALSADHRTRVQSIVGQVNAGTLDRRAASQQIDELLTPNEKTAISALSQKSRDEMRSLRESSGMTGGPPAGAPQGGPPRGGTHRTPDPGRFLVMVLRAQQPGASGGFGGGGPRR
jgi:hypothetical protein